MLRVVFFFEKFIITAPIIANIEIRVAVESRVPMNPESDPESESIHPVIVVPIFVPNTIGTACERVIIPALTKLITMTVVAPED